MKYSFDTIVEKIAALGVPGLVLIVTMALVGPAGGAAIVLALATLGGPLGMMGGLALLGLLVLISNALAEWGLDKVFSAVLQKLKDKGMSKDHLLSTIDGYWFLSAKRKQRLKNLVDKWYR